MKRLSPVLILLLFSISLRAQVESQEENDEIRSLFGKNGVTTIGWVFGIEQGYLQFSNRDMRIGGASAGMLINHRFIAGVSGHAWTLNNGIIYPEVTDTTDVYAEGGYGGLLLGYMLLPESRVHVTFSLILGVGGDACFTQKEYTKWNGDKAITYHKMVGAELFYAMEPGGQLQLNLFKSVRLKAGISYCYAGNHLSQTSRDLMNSFKATVGIEIGRF